MDTAKLFANGQSQAVRLPKAYRFEGSHVYLKRMGRAVVLLPARSSWKVLEESLHHFTTDFMRDRSQPAGQQKRSGLWD